MLGAVITLSSLLLASPIVARPTANPLGTSLLLNRQGQVTGIGPIAPGCETPCNPLVSVFADASIQDATVTCASNVVNQVEACFSCEAGVLGFDQSTIEDTLTEFENECAAAGVPVSITVNAPGPAPSGSSSGGNSGGGSGVTGIGPIAPGCETQCSPLVPVFANASVQDPTVTCASNVVNQVAACASCEAGVLGFDQSSIEAGLSNFKNECAAAGIPVSFTVSAAGPVATTASSSGTAGSQSSGSNGSSGNTLASGTSAGAKTSNAPTSTSSGDGSSPSATDEPKKNGGRRLATSGGMLGALFVGLALVVL